MIRPLLRLSTWRVDNESPSMAGASPAHFLSPVMSISSRTINLGNNTESQHLRSYYVHQYRLAEREKKWGLKNLFNLISEKIEFCQLEFSQCIDSKCFVQISRRENAISKSNSNTERERSHHSDWKWDICSCNRIN